MWGIPAPGVPMGRLAAWVPLARRVGRVMSGMTVVTEPLQQMLRACCWLQGTAVAEGAVVAAARAVRGVGVVGVAAAAGVAGAADAATPPGTAPAPGWTMVREARVQAGQLAESAVPAARAEILAWGATEERVVMEAGLWCYRPRGCSGIAAW